MNSIPNGCRILASFQSSIFVCFAAGFSEKEVQQNSSKWSISISFRRARYAIVIFLPGLFRTDCPEPLRRNNTNSATHVTIRLGALVSAGFEVSATVVHDHHGHDFGHSSMAIMDIADGGKRRNGLDANSSSSTNNRKSNDNILDSMVDWLTNVPENEL